MISVTAMTPLEDLRAWMAAHNVDAAYITKPVSIAYLTGFHAEPFERLMALAVRKDRATLIVPAIEREKAAGHAATLADIVSWRDGEDAYALVHAALEGCAEVGVEKEHLSVQAAETLLTRTAAREMVDVSPELRRRRRIKNQSELDKLAHAASITDAVGEEIIARLRPGQTELEISVMIGAAIGAHGGVLSFESLVQSGPNSALPHLHPSGRKLRHGDYVLLDFGAAFDGYKADTTRMAVVGEPDEKHAEIHRLVLEAHDAAAAAVRAGATTGSVDAAARKVIEAAGLGDHFFHRTGHGLGLEAHEEPNLDPGSSFVLEPGMVFTIEPGIYIPGWGGVRIEDDVVVEPSGCKLLTKMDRSLRVISEH
ncbi:MAG: Xaa-Pro dipeptidase [Candidatus Dormibacteraceae bacterium]